MGDKAFPESWIAKDVAFIEPHYDDFYLNSYMLFKQMMSRSSYRANSLTIVTVSQSDVNHQNGMRSILPNKTDRIRLIELGLPDLIDDKKFKDEFMSKYGMDHHKVMTHKLVEWYSDHSYGYELPTMRYALASVMMQNNVIVLPVARSWSHPFHRLVTHFTHQTYNNLIAEQAITGREFGWYFDNPYFRESEDAVINENSDALHINYLTDWDMALKSATFAEHFKQQAYVQITWHNKWMLKTDQEVYLVKNSNS